MMEHDQRDFYQRLRARVTEWLATRDGAAHRWADVLFLAPDLFHLLCRLAADGDVPLLVRGRLLAAVTYFVSPLDLVPEALLGPAGYVDDVALAAWVLQSVVSAAGPAVLRKHWAGDGDVLIALHRVLGMAESMVGRRGWARLRGLLGFGGRRSPA